MVRTGINKKRWLSSGFTILELAAVIVIIGILAAIISVSYVNITERARATQLQSDLEHASAQLEVYFVDHGEYPAVGSEFVANLTRSDGTEYTYVLDGDDYHLTATSTVDEDLAYNVDPDGAITEGEYVPFGYALVSAATFHTCALDYEGLAYCWGENSDGQLGDNSTTDSYVPVEVDMTGVLSGKTLSKIEGGFAYTCALASDSNAYCWGSGRLGTATTESHVPVAVSTSGVLSGKTISDISVGNAHTCVIASDSKAYCWGDNGYGQLGNGSTTTSNQAPVAVDTTGVLSGKSLVSISTGYSHTCAVDSLGAVYCWGRNLYGQLGNNSTTNSTVPVAVNMTGVLSGKTVSSVDTGSSSVCVIASDNKAYCWGDNGLGQLGNNSTTSSSVPVAVNTSGVLSGKSISLISVEGGHTCAITTDENTACWGSNYHSELGDNTTTNSSVPVTVSILDGHVASMINTGYDYTCLITTDDHLYHCWGYNDYGQLGNGSVTTGGGRVPLIF